MNTDLKYLFENLKDGDCLFFYHDQWWAIFSKIIKLFTGSKVDHVGICLEVQRDSNSCQFMFGEQTYKHGGVYRPFEIQKFNDTYVLRGFSATELFYGSLKSNASKKQIECMILDAKEQVGKKYGVNNLSKTINWLEKLLPKQWTNKYYDTLRICSTNVVICWFKSKIISKQIFELDKFRSPIEVMKMNHIEVYKITDYSNF